LTGFNAVPAKIAGLGLIFIIITPLTQKGNSRMIRKLPVDN